MESIEIKRHKAYLFKKWYYWSVIIILIVSIITESKFQNRLGYISMLIIILIPILLLYKSLFKEKKPNIFIDKKGILFRNFIRDVYFEWDKIDKISIRTQISLRNYRKKIEIKRENEKWVFTKNNYDITTLEFKKIVKEISAINLEIIPIIKSRYEN